MDASRSVFHKSVFGVKCDNNTLKLASDFLQRFVSHPNSADLEVEVKLGKFLSNATDERLRLPIMSEAVLQESQRGGFHYRFDSQVSQLDFQHYNKILNCLVTTTNRPDYRGMKVGYKHSVERDQFHDQGIRVTIDEAGKKSAMNKEKLGHLNIYCPSNAFDLRLSANVEHQREVPSTPPRRERRKDRLSYRCPLFSFDLTKVYAYDRMQGPNPVGEPQITYELELELADSAKFVAEGMKRSQRQPQQFDDMVQGLLDHARVMATFTHTRGAPPMAVAAPAPGHSSTPGRPQQQQQKPQQASGGSGSSNSSSHSSSGVGLKRSSEGGAGGGEGSGDGAGKADAAAKASSFKRPRVAGRSSQ